MLVEIGGRPFLRHDRHDRHEGAVGARPGRDQPHALQNAGMMAVEDDRAPIEGAGVHHAGSDLAPDTGKLFEPAHRRLGLHVCEMREIDRASPLDQRREAGLEPLGGNVGIGLRGKFSLKFVQRRCGHGFPASPSLQHPVGGFVRHLRLRPRADHPLHQHPLRLAPFGRRPLDPPEPLDQQRLQAAQRIGAWVGAKGELQIRLLILTRTQRSHRTRN